MICSCLRLTTSWVIIWVILLYSLEGVFNLHTFSFGILLILLYWSLGVNLTIWTKFTHHFSVIRAIIHWAHHITASPLFIFKWSLKIWFINIVLTQVIIFSNILLYPCLIKTNSEINFFIKSILLSLALFKWFHHAIIDLKIYNIIWFWINAQLFNIKSVFIKRWLSYRWFLGVMNIYVKT